MKKIVTRSFVLLAALLVAAPGLAQTPNRGDVVRALASGAGAALMQSCQTSKVACGQFTRLAACALEADGFGLLTKQPGQNQYEGYAVDAIIHKATNQVVDIISQNESPSAAATWSEVAKRDGNEWAPPVGCSQTPPPPPPPSGVTREELDVAIKAARVDLHTSLWNELAAELETLRSRVAKLEAGPSQTGTPPPDVALEQLAATKAILELLKKTAARFGVQ